MLNNIKNTKKSSNSSKNEEIKKVVLYARISREKNHGGSDVSLDNQIASGRNWAQLNGYEVIAEYREVQSAKKVSNRPVFKKALELVKKEKCVLFLHSLSRGFRSTVNAIETASELEKSGSDLVSWNDKIDTTTPMGRFFYTLLNAVNQLDREQISHRTKEALDHKKTKSEKLGGRVPFGYKVGRDGKTLVKNASEYKVVREIVAMRENNATFVSIASALDYKKIKTRTGAGWSAKVVRGIILREAEQEQFAAAA